MHRWIRYGFGNLCCVALTTAGGAHVALAGDTDKQVYTLFNPTPAALLRDMTTDRPDTTESPFTVDAGHIQIETQVFGYSSADDVGGHIDAYEFGASNFRIGLTNSVEFATIIAPYGTIQGPDGLDDDGAGGIEIRPKINLWGNDGFGEAHKTAFGLLPYVRLPTDSDNGISPEKAEFGLILPLAIHLSDTLGLGVNATIESISDESGDGRHAESAATASFSYAWNDRLGTYYELAARFGAEDGEELVAGTGVTYLIHGKLQLDAGVNFGLTDAADDFEAFTGVSVRF